MKDFKRNLQVWFQNPRSRLSLLLGLICVVALSVYQAASAPPIQTEEAWGTSDEYIPDGYSLVPLVLQNNESLQTLVGAFAYVNLYTTSMDGLSKGTLIGKRVKLVRTPQNPQQFSALVPMNEAATLLGQQAPLFAAVLGRKSGPESKTPRKEIKSRVQIVQGDSP